MQRKPQRFSRLCAFILAVIMIVGMVPTTVFAMDGPLSGETGNGWGGVGGGSSSGAGNDLALGGSNIEDTDNDKVMDSGNHKDEILDADKLPPIDDAALKLKEKVELFNRQIEAYSQWAQNFSRKRANSRVSILATLPLGGNTEWKSGLAANPYMVGRPIPVVQINGNYAFCVEWDTPNPSGNYEDGSPYTAAPVMQVLANFKQYTAANPGNINEAYLAAQFAIWQYVTTTSVNLNNFLMWSSNIPSGVRNAIFNGGADTTGISATNWKNPTGEPQTQALITFDDNSIYNAKPYQYYAKHFRTHYGYDYLDIKPYTTRETPIGCIYTLPELRGLAELEANHYGAGKDELDKMRFTRLSGVFFSGAGAYGIYNTERTAIKLRRSGEDAIRAHLNEWSSNVYKRSLTIITCVS